MIRVFFIFFIFHLVACNPKQAESASEDIVSIDANEAYYQSIKHMTGLEFQPRIQKADSVQILFYNDPDGDPKRYTRFYKWLPTSDTAIVQGVKEAVNKSFIRIEKVKDCRSEGKIHLFSGENPMQTIYFSNRGDSCSHLYFIADGWFFYMDMDSAAAQFLKSLKPRASQPPGDLIIQ